MAFPVRKQVSLDELAWMANTDDEETMEVSSTVTTFEKMLSDRESGDTVKNKFVILAAVYCYQS